MWSTKRSLATGAGAVLAVLAFTVPTDLPANALEAAPDAELNTVPSECELTLRPAEIQRVPDAVPVRITLSEEIGEIQGVSLDERSRVKVEQVETPSPAALVLTLLTEEAQEGEWTVTVSGEDGECTGTLTVEGGLGHAR